MSKIQINYDLPISRYEEQITSSLETASNLIVIGETGSGKTTQIPLIILNSILKRYGHIGQRLQDIDLGSSIAITQPRRIAATSVADYVAKQIGEEVGQDVGYRIRFHDITTPQTKLVFMTDGILLREAQVDPLLMKYSVVMVDEAHERNINSDFLIGLLVDIQKNRRLESKIPLQIIISSATLEKEKFLEYLDRVEGENYDCIEIPGRMFPVEKIYLEHDILEYEKKAAAIVDKICLKHQKKLKSLESTKRKQKFQTELDNTPKHNDLNENNKSLSKFDGDILIFMPGKREIEKTKNEIINLKHFQEYGLELITIHADLPIEEQNKIFTSITRRKVVIATNIAETSITVPGIVHVIDSGLIKQMDFSPTSGIHSLVTKFHAKKGLIQRMGRAGRVQEGMYHALFTRYSYDSRDEFPMPEILRSSLSQIILVMKKIGIHDIHDFKFIDPPRNSAIKHAVKELKNIKAIDGMGNITEKGEELVNLPIEPRLGNLILEAHKLGVIEDVITIASFLELKPLLLNLSLQDFIDQVQRENPECFDTHEIERKAYKEYLMYKQKAGKFVDPGSDLYTFLRIWDKWVETNYNENWVKSNYLSIDVLEESKNIRDELLQIVMEMPFLKKKKNAFHQKKFHQRNCKNIEEVFIKSFGYNILAKFKGFGLYKNIISNTTGIRLHGSSAVYETKPSFLLAYEVIEINEIDNVPKLSAKILHALSYKVIKKYFPHELKKFERKVIKMKHRHSRFNNGDGIHRKHSKSKKRRRKR